MSYIIYSLKEFENLLNNNSLSNFSKTKKCKIMDINLDLLKEKLNKDSYDNNIIFFKQDDEIKYYFEFKLGNIVNNIHDLFEFYKNNKNDISILKKKFPLTLCTEILENSDIKKFLLINKMSVKSPLKNSSIKHLANFKDSNNKIKLKYSFKLNQDNKLIFNSSIIEIKKSKKKIFPKRRNIKKFGQCLTEGNKDVTLLGPEVFIENPNSKFQDTIPKIKIKKDNNQKYIPPSQRSGFIKTTIKDNNQNQPEEGKYIPVHLRSDFVKKEKNNNSDIHLSGYHFETTKEEIYGLLEQYLNDNFISENKTDSNVYVPPSQRNKIKNIKNIFMKNVKYSNGINSFCFVSFYKKEHAKFIIDACNNKMIRFNNTILDANWRKPRKTFS